MHGDERVNSRDSERTSKENSPRGMPQMIITPPVSSKTRN